MHTFIRLAGIMLCCAIAATGFSQTTFLVEFSVTETWKQAASIMLDNEVAPSEAGPNANFSWNPLILNNKVLDYTHFYKTSRGVLAVVKGNPELPNAEQIPFHIYLRRKGVIINEGASSSTRQVYSLEISEVLKNAQLDDHLIIEPVRKADRQAKRIIRLINGPGC